MKLSICIFTFNHEDYIAKAIESALMQVTDFEFEIVIAEDCSTDSTRDIVNFYKKKFPQKIKLLLNQRNLGMMENNSYAITQCGGEYIALLDGDDYWTYNKKLQTQVNFLDSNPNYSLCFHDGKVLNINKELTETTCCGPNQKRVIQFTDVICDTHIPTFSLVFRKAALVEYPPKWFKTLNAPDRPLFLLLTSFGPGYYFNECWGVYRKHLKGSWTGQHYQSQWLTHLQIYRTLNRHFLNKYKKSFCKCEGKVSYKLAMLLIKDNRTQRGICYFRKYVKSNHDTYIQVCVNIFVFYLILIKKRFYIK